MLRPTCLVLIALVAGCARSEPATPPPVDINAAAIAAQGSVDAYGANSVGHHRGRTAEAHALADVPAANTTQGNAASAPLAPPAPGAPGGLPDDRTPVSEAPVTPDSAQGAAQVVQRYYAAIEAHDYAAARALWARDSVGAGASAAAFAKQFAAYGEYHAAIGAPGPIDPGAGQRYVTIPVQIRARRLSGQPIYQIGTVTLHRTVVDGAPAADHDWHLTQIALQPAPGH